MDPAAGAGRTSGALRSIVAVLLLAAICSAVVVERAIDAAALRSAAGLAPEAPPSTTAGAVEPVPTTSTTVPVLRIEGTTIPAPVTTVTAPVSPTTARPAPPKPAPASRPPVKVPPMAPAGTHPHAGLEAFQGLGTWLDVYDWSRSYTKGNPQSGPDDVDRMAGVGVQTLYIQASKWDSPTDVVDADLLIPIIERARQRGIRVVAWYLPTLEDPGRDLQRLLAIARLGGVDAIGVDIEARNVADVAERNRRLVEFSASARQFLPGRVLAAIVLPPVVLEVINPSYWPGFPYQQLAPSYDLWMTMGYWTNRKDSSGYRDAYRYTLENVQRLRANLGNPAAIVHPIGGEGRNTTAADVAGYRRAAGETACIGGSLYDWRITPGELWEPMRSFRV